MIKDIPTLLAQVRRVEISGFKTLQREIVVQLGLPREIILTGR